MFNNLLAGLKVFLEKRKIARVENCNDPCVLLQLAQNARMWVGTHRAIEIAEQAYAHHAATLETRLRSAYSLTIWHTNLADEMFLNRESIARHRQDAGRYFFEACKMLEDPHLSRQEKLRFALLLSGHAESQDAPELSKSILHMA